MEAGFRPESVWLYSDGLYRWIYVRDLYKSRFETNYVLKIMMLVFGLSWVAMVGAMLVAGVGGDGALMGLGIVTAICLGGGLLTVGIIRAAHLASARYRGGAEVIGFAMKGDGLRQIHYEGAQTAGEVADRLMLVDGAMQQGGFGVTLFRDVRRMDLHPNEDLIDLTLKGNYKCRVYVQKEDFDFVRDYIREHTPK